MKFYLNVPYSSNHPYTLIVTSEVRQMKFRQIQMIAQVLSILTSIHV